jgi:hypothetical protein
MVKILLVCAAPDALAPLTAALRNMYPQGLEIETAGSVHTAQRMLRAEQYVVVVINSTDEAFVCLAERLLPRLTEYGNPLDQVIVLDYEGDGLNAGITRLYSADNFSNVVTSVGCSVAVSMSEQYSLVPRPPR